jgi:hypothetical protein
MDRVQWLIERNISKKPFRVFRSGSVPYSDNFSQQKNLATEKGKGPSGPFLHRRPCRQIHYFFAAGLAAFFAGAATLAFAGAGAAAGAATTFNAAR